MTVWMRLSISKWAHIGSEAILDDPTVGYIQTETRTGFLRFHYY